MSSAAPLIQTKLQAPQPRGFVARDELLGRLLEGGPHPLTLVLAPAGSGKTTLLSEWGASEREPRPFAWLSVDSRDDDSTLFWNYVIAALRTVVPGICERPLALLRAPGTEAVREMLPLLINEIASLREPIVLVLDDYHLVEDPAIHEELSYLIEHLPAQLQVVVLSRTEPPLPLARLRVRGQLAEVDARALSFSETETRALVNDLHGLTLGADDVLRLRDRTEGWAAGLYLAVLSLDGRDDAGGFITAFAGDDRQVVDYLGTEVLAGQSDEVREFMLRTSILERLSAPACDALTDAPDSARLLGEIARSNFFLVPLDTKGERYRYHHLFGQLLRHELLRTRPELASELHRRAGAWLLAAGYASDAIHHTIAAGDISEAGELIAEHWAPTLMGAAGDRTVDSWLSGLPDEAIRADVRLAFARCFVGLSLGHMDEVEKWLAAGEAAPLPAPFRDGVASAKGALACVRAAFLWERGDVSAAMEAGHDARQAEEGSPWEAIGVAVIGLAHAARGQWQEGREWMAEYARIGSESGHHLNHSSGLSTASACHAELGDWEAAERTATQALDIARRHGIDEHWCTAHAHLAQGLALESRGDSAAAGDALERALERARRGSGPVYTAWPLLHLVRLRSALGKRDGARALLEEARVELASARDSGIMAERLIAAEESLAATPTRCVPAGEPLSDRELAVLHLLATELTQREIGRELYLSLNTVKTHARNIFRKLGASSRDDAVSRARHRGLL
ncbi:MAG TPA: LuxR C-terminal-related transcriptional regulator [Thermoleophilaceae bacterium]|nr:LuxR C-terminal-related transcriptional regulator [Thermoleophilaceae bacterium]